MKALVIIGIKYFSADGKSPPKVISVPHSIVVPVFNGTSPTSLWLAAERKGKQRITGNSSVFMVYLILRKYSFFPPLQMQLPLAMLPRLTLYILKHLYSAVTGSIIVSTSLITFAGNPPFCACSSIISLLGAM